MIVYWPADGRRQTISYPKWLMEQHLGRMLSRSETVDHKNRDFTDDNIENLQVLTASEHAYLDAIRRKPVDAVCSWCSKQFTIKHRINDRARGSAGPFCTRACSGQYGAAVQNGLVDPSEPYDISKEYYQIDKNNK